MRIHAISDCHIEFGKFRHNPPECDVAILAGDIGVGAMALPWISETFIKHGIQVVYVVGNHEFYGRDLSTHLIDLEKKCTDRGIIFLNNKAVEIGDVTILGATLWTDYNMYGNYPIAMLDAQRNLNDFNNIKLNGEKLFAEDIRVLHQESVEFLTSYVNKPGKKIVVTHHAPSEFCVAPKFIGDLLNPCYASRLESLICNLEAEIWIHGHRHDSVDIMINKTRILCNPRGYAGYQLNSNFNSQLVVEV